MAGDLNFHQLALFRAVGHAGGVGAAAESLSISQPSVTIQVCALERSLGLTLLERSGRTVRLTERGRRVLEYADCIFTLADDLRREAAELRAGTAGRLVVGASTTVGEYVLPEVLGRFRKELAGRRDPRRGGQQRHGAGPPTSASGISGWWASRSTIRSCWRRRSRATPWC